MDFKEFSNQQTCFFPFLVSMSTNDRTFSKQNRDFDLINLLEQIIQNQNTITIVDIGGGVDLHYKFILTQTHITQKQLKYYIIEIPAVCESARNINKNISYFENISLLPLLQIDVLYSNSGMAYIDNDIDDIFKLKAKYILFNRIGCSTKDNILIQDYGNNQLIKYKAYNIDKFITMSEKHNYKCIFCVEDTKYKVNDLITIVSNHILLENIK